LNADRHLGCWLAAPDIVFIEMARDIGFGTLLLDAEHGTLALRDLDQLIPFARAIGMEVLVKVAGPQAEPIQQALDLGAHGVVVPHVLGADHARTVCAAAKYPPMGTRSYAGARTVRYKAPVDTYFEDENRLTRCFPMVESREALADIAAILALPSVDGIFLGPSDLSLSRGRGKYRFSGEDRGDALAVRDACAAAGKPWLMPAWRKDEQSFAREQGADVVIVVEQQAAMYIGLEQAFMSARK
jgi:4-hydroxy-2-oxoheptanedioate aldolase